MSYKKGAKIVIVIIDFSTKKRYYILQLQFNNYKENIVKILMLEIKFGMMIR